MYRTIKEKSYPIWTIMGALLVGNNLVHWKDPEHQTSALARRHKLITCLVLAAYGYHFLLEEDSESSDD